MNRRGGKFAYNVREVFPERNQKEMAAAMKLIGKEEGLKGLALC